MTKKIILATLMTLTLSACGGGGSSGDDTEQSTAARDAIQGTWLSDCITESNGTSSLVAASFDSEDGFDITAQGLETFNTSNCTGTGSLIVLGGPVDYLGETATSICTAEKVNFEITAITDGETTLAGQDATDFLDFFNIPNESYDLFCNYDNHLLLGLKTATLDSYSEAGRPVEMNVQIPLNPVTGSARAATSNTSNLLAKMQQNINAQK